MQPEMLKTVLNALALAMGVAVVVLNIVAPPPVESTTSMLAVGLAALGIAGLQK